MREKEFCVRYFVTLCEKRNFVSDILLHLDPGEISSTSGDSLPLSMMIYSRVCVANSVLHHNKLQAILADSNDLLTKKIARSLCALDNDANYSRFSDNASAMHNLVGSMKEVKSVEYNRGTARYITNSGEEWKVNDGKPKNQQLPQPRLTTFSCTRSPSFYIPQT
jgi:hypothetical protein